MFSSISFLYCDNLNMACGSRASSTQIIILSYSVKKKNFAEYNERLLYTDIMQIFFCFDLPECFNPPVQKEITDLPDISTIKLQCQHLWTE